VLVFSTGSAGLSEVEVLSLVECDADGRMIAGTAFDANDLETAYAVLEARAAELDADAHLAWFENAAWRAASALRDASNRRDWQDATNLHDPKFVYFDFMHGNNLRFEGAHAFAPLNVLFGIDESRQWGELLATRGDRLALMREYVWMLDGVAGPAEIETLSLVETGLDGKMVTSTVMTPDDMDKALDLLDAAYVAQGGSEFTGMRSSFAPDARLRIDHIREQGDVALIVGRAREIQFASVGRVGPDGSGAHLENYVLTDFAIALRRFEELTG
jgi:hypothetical protein